MNFFIPSYQRGYRWDKQQVEELLDDIYTFAIKHDKTEKEFYCLQPIIVKEWTWEKTKSKKKITGWEVVDGQQRLTTIRIILSYLIKEHLNGKSLKESYGKDLFTITYETRDDSEDFLDNITVENDECIDYFFISSAYKTVDVWFTRHNKPHGVRSAILNTLVYPYKDLENPNKGVVQVIWYEIKDPPEKSSAAIDMFLRINQGKILLTNSELIKALLLRERNFFKNGQLENEIARLKQLQIATEWDHIECELQNEDFWWFLNENQNKIPARIDYVFNLIKEETILTDPELEVRKSLTDDQIEERKRHSPSIQERIGSDAYSSFRYFYQYFDMNVDFESLKNEWDMIKSYYSFLNEWFNDPVWYHYIGYLIACGVRIIDIYQITQLHFLTNDKIRTKDEITDSLKQKIKSRLKSLKWKVDSNQKIFLDLAYTNENKRVLREFLLLYNIEYIVKQCVKKILKYMFPFKAFKEIDSSGGGKMLWDIEHIDSHNANNLPNRDTKVIWLQFALEEIDDTTENSELIIKILSFIQSEKSIVNFDELHEKVITLLNENEPDENLKNNIGNLALLDAGTNKGYGNALFPTKRKKIIEKDKLGVFIPICTKNVFLKYFDTSGKSNAKWSTYDMKKYRSDIEETLEYFLPTKPEINKNEENE
jgi:hypothetical protein